MTTTTSLNDLVQRWQELRSQGQAVSADEICIDCPELLDELRRQIDALVSMEQFLGASVDVTLSARLIGTSGHSGGDETLPAVPGYEVRGVLGRGGMGVVYLARQRGLDRTVALKMLLAGTRASPEEVVRFRTEAQAVARLQHRNIVQIHEVGEHDGLPYISLEYCADGSLARRLAGTPMSPNDAAALVNQLAAAMHTAHQAGVVHRDLKPANVLLTADGTPKITDFGLAKRLDVEGQTQSNMILGTPSYMAPEQAGGTGGVVGPAADVYALGALLYECLIGRPPFKSDTPWDTLRQVLDAEPVPLRRLNAKVPRNLETIALKCLQKEPSRRYASAADLADDLRRFLDGRPILARPAGWGEQLWLWTRRQPARAAAYALLALTLLLGGGGGSAAWLWQRAEWGWHEAARARDDLVGEMAQTELAQRGEAAARERLDRAFYIHTISLAHGAWRDQDVGRAQRLLVECPAKWRGWEWDYVDHLCHTEQLLFRGHSDYVRRVAFSTDGAFLASGDQRGVVCVHHLPSGAELRTPFHVSGSRWVYGLAFSRDCRRVASAHGGGVVTVWETRTGRPVCSFSRPGYAPLGLAFSADGTRLACAGGWVRDNNPLPTKGEVKLLDAATGQEMAAFAAPELALSAVAFSADGRRVFAAGPDLRREGEHTFPGDSCGLIAWDAATGKLTTVLPARLYNCTRPVFSADGKLVAGACRDWVVRVWETESGKEAMRLPGHTGVVHDVAFSPDGRRLVSGSADRTVRLWHLIRQKELVVHQGHVRDVLAVAFAPDGQKVASGSADTTVRIWSANSNQEALQLAEPDTGGFTADLAFTPDGKSLIAAHHYRVDQHDLSTGRLIVSRPVRPLALHQGALTLSRDGKRYAAAAGDTQVNVWDFASGQVIRAVEVDTPHLSLLALGPDGRLLAVATWKQKAPGTVTGDLNVWDIATAQPVLSLPDLDHALDSLAFSPDGRRLAGGTGWWIKVWELANGREVFQVPGHQQPVASLAFSPDGRRLVSGSHDGTAKLWDLTAAGEAMTLTGHFFYVERVAFTPGGDRLVTGSRDGSIRVWDAGSGLEILSLRAPGHVRSLAVSNDGRRIAAGRDGFITVWDSSAPMLRSR
jgi:WD40 repeat protein